MPRDFQPGSGLTDSIHDCACNNLRKAVRAVTQYYDDVMRPSGLRVTQFGLLSTIGEFGTATIGALAELSVMDRTTLTRNLKLLEQEGLVTIAAGQDARVREVSLTPEARERLAVAYRYWKKAQTHVGDVMGVEAVRRLFRGLSHVVEAARAE
jgi:DNA-binding MarR family transcriptional regulator